MIRLVLRDLGAKSITQVRDSSITNILDEVQELTKLGDGLAKLKGKNGAFVPNFMSLPQEVLVNSRQKLLF